MDFVNIFVTFFKVYWIAPLEEDEQAEEGHDDELVEVVLEGEVLVLAAALLLRLLQAQLVLLAAATVPSPVSEEKP